jgi:hypothetical protein
VKFFLEIFPTVSYRKCRLKKVRIDLTEGRKGSSYAKRCILLTRLGAGNGFKKIPLPAPLKKPSEYAAIWASTPHTLHLHSRRSGFCDEINQGALNLSH